MDLFDRGQRRDRILAASRGLIEAQHFIRCGPAMAMPSSGAGRARNVLSAIIGRLRDECLNETLFSSLARARAVLIAWQTYYNAIRPHSGLGNLPPATYAQRSAPGMQRSRPLT